MRRGGIRTQRRYVIDENGKKIIKFQIQGRRNGVWIPVVEKNKLKEDVPMIYNTIEEAEAKLKEIHKQVVGSRNASKNKA
jgi:hypothetical protein